jgi:hypothetical protein
MSDANQVQTINSNIVNMQISQTDKDQELQGEKRSTPKV